MTNDADKTSEAAQRVYEYSRSLYTDLNCPAWDDLTERQKNDVRAEYARPEYTRVCEVTIHG